MINPGLVGIIPMAGKATRLGNLPCSKELYPLRFKEGKVRVVSHHLFDSMNTAGAGKIHIVIRDGKWDIPRFFGSDYGDGVAIVYHMATYDYGVPFTLNQAYPFMKNDVVLLGFPDIIFKPNTAYTSVVEKLLSSDAAIVLGLFPVSKSSKFDRVEMDNDNRITKIFLKPGFTDSGYAWILAAWKPEFSDFLNHFVGEMLEKRTESELTQNELHFRHVISTAMENGMTVRGVVFDEGKCMDTGTPEEMNVASAFFDS